MTLLYVDDREEHIRYKQYTEERKSEDNHSMRHHPGHYGR